MNGTVLAYAGFAAGEEGLREALTSTGNGHSCTRGVAERWYAGASAIPPPGAGRSA